MVVSHSGCVPNIVFDGSFSKESFPAPPVRTDCFSFPNIALICHMPSVVSSPKMLWGHRYAFSDEEWKNNLFHDLQLKRMHDKRFKRTIVRFVSSERCL